MYFPYKIFFDILNFIENTRMSKVLWKALVNEHRIEKHCQNTIIFERINVTG